MLGDDESGSAEWQRLEKRVRKIASLIWNRQAGPREVNGVRLDCVLEVDPEYWVSVEITTNASLTKMRTDLAKFQTIKHFLMSQGKLAKCFFVSLGEPPPSVRTSAEGLGITVMTEAQFSNQFFNYENYLAVRRSRSFGSSVNPVSGKPDESEYVPVHYRDASTGKTITVDDLADYLAAGTRLVLLGEYGTGKSRGLREAFARLTQSATHKHIYPIAIDLRDNWGTRRATEILRRHFDDLGLSNMADSSIKILGDDSLCFLLDGFDELGSQAWSDDPNKLKSIRQQSLQGVKDLIRSAGGGIAICGREHYFNSSAEMFQSLGLDPEKTKVIHCENEFTADEMQKFLEGLNHDIVLPEWLPRRPLMCQIISSLDEDDLDRIFEQEGGDVAFWNTVVDVICEREARIAPILDPATIKHVLRRIGRTTRTKPQEVGPVSVSEINRAFEAVTGFPPVDESAVMLQRLPALGRPSAEASDRQFVDIYILDGLRALDVIHCLSNPNDGCDQEAWINPLGSLGQAVAASQLDSTEPPKTNLFLAHAKRCAAGRNKVLATDIVTSLQRSSRLTSIDYQGLTISEGALSVLDLATVAPSRLKLFECTIRELIIPSKDPSEVEITQCLIEWVRGVSSEKGMPAWIASSVERFDAVSTLSQIKAAKLEPRQQILVSIVKKTFFQKGSARKEEALFRGLSRLVSQSDINGIINVLLREKILEKVKGGDGSLYVPVRQNSHRMKKMLSDLGRSTDPIWIEVSKKP